MNIFVTNNMSNTVSDKKVWVNNMNNTVSDKKVGRNNINNIINGIPIIISHAMTTSNLVPKRKHHNKRIKKKWAKRFGYTFEYDDNIMFIDNKIYVSPRGYKKLLKIIERRNKCNII